MKTCYEKIGGGITPAPVEVNAHSGQSHVTLSVGPEAAEGVPQLTVDRWDGVTSFLAYGADEESPSVQLRLSATGEIAEVLVDEKHRDKIKFV